jgi:hypothetical protein
MNAARAPDVDRVLERMGTSAFAYRSFPRTPEPAALPVTAREAAPVGTVSLVGAAPPQADRTATPAAAPAASAPTNPAPVVAPQGAIIQRPPGAGMTSLAVMFHLLSGAERALPHSAVHDARPAFPFRRG